MIDSDNKALIFDIYRGTTHDGPGLRTTIFLKGCPLKCKWCHNPESIDFQNQVWYTRRKCIGCQTCNAVSGMKIVSVENDEITLAVEPNEIPEARAQNCPTKALSMVAKEFTVDEAYKEAIKDRVYFDSFEGGVTVSGGEPVSNYKFVKELLKKLKNEGIHTALDTSGFAKWEVYEELLPYVDCLLYDIKLIDGVQHKNLTGVDNELILSNLEKVIEYKKSVDRNLTIWIRTPLIPFATANETNIEKIGIMLKKTGENEIDRWELCAFNNTCKNKYEQLGSEWEYKDTELLSEGKTDELLTIAKVAFAIEKTIVTGFTRKE